jgi:hypothetical protein
MATKFGNQARVWLLVSLRQMIRLSILWGRLGFSAKKLLARFFFSHVFLSQIVVDLNPNPLTLLQDLLSFRTSERFSYFKFFNFVEYWTYFSGASRAEFQSMASQRGCVGAGCFIGQALSPFMSAFPKYKTQPRTCAEMHQTAHKLDTC